MENDARAADAHRREEITAKFKLGTIRSKLLERQAMFMDADAQRRQVETTYKRLNAGVVRDLANDADPVVKAENNKVASVEMQNLPNVQNAKDTVDANTHPCDAIDSLKKDPLCSLKAAAVDAAQNDFESNTLHDGTDAPVELMEVHEGAGYNLGYVAKMHNDEVGNDISERVREAGMHVLDQAPTIDPVQLEAYENAQNFFARNAASEAVEDTAEPKMAERTNAIMAGAQSMKRADMAANHVEVSDALYDNHLRKQRGEDELDRTVRLVHTSEAIQNAMANNVLQQALKRRMPDIRDSTLNRESQIEAKKQEEAAARVRRTNRMIQRRINNEKLFEQRRQQQMSDIMKMEQHEMSSTQRIVDGTYEKVVDGRGA